MEEKLAQIETIVTRENRMIARAHELWVEQGRPDGKLDEHWLQAGREIDATDIRKSEEFLAELPAWLKRSKKVEVSQEPKVELKGNPEAVAWRDISWSPWRRKAS